MKEATVLTNVELTTKQEARLIELFTSWGFTELQIDHYADIEEGIEESGFAGIEFGRVYSKGGKIG